MVKLQEHVRRSRRIQASYLRQLAPPWPSTTDAAGAAARRSTNMRRFYQRSRCTLNDYRVRCIVLTHP